MPSGLPPPKKRKQSPGVGDDVGRAPKRPKKEAKSKEKTQEGSNEFRVVSTSLTVSIPPAFASRPREGVQEMLDSMLMRYVRALQGVLLSHSHLRFVNSTATLKGDCPFANTTATFDATVWSPQIGMKLSGTLNLCSPDHISLLVHRTFNVSIPRHHIPEDHWEFEYGPAENDPEFGPKSIDDAVKELHNGSKWTHKVTGEMLGDRGDYVDFVVIGFTIANQMLSLVGSLQPDPFSPDHVPRTTVVARMTRPSEFVFEEELGDDVKNDGDEDEDEDEEDPFAHLGRQGDAAAAKHVEEARVRDDETVAKAAKKKRKEERRLAKEQKREQKSRGS